MATFKKGDIVTGNAANRYDITNRDAVMRVMEDCHGDYLKVEIISRKDRTHIGSILDGLNPDVFCLVEQPSSPSNLTLLL